MENLYQLLADAANQGRSVALATVVRVEGSVPREIGAKMVVYADGTIAGTIGGGEMEALVIREAVQAIAQGKPRPVHYTLQDASAGDPGVCGGVADVFVDVVIPRPTLLVLGAGHVGMPIAEVGHLCGFKVIVVDDRADMVSAERFPHADERIARDFVDALRDLEITPGTYVVIVTRGHAYDKQVLHAVIDSPAAYVGMIGSRRKVQVIFDHLRAAGVAEALIRRVYSPIGLDIGGRTPAEIAVSILAEIVALRHGKLGAPQDRRIKSKNLE